MSVTRIASALLMLIVLGLTGAKPLKVAVLITPVQHTILTQVMGDQNKAVWLRHRKPAYEFRIRGRDSFARSAAVC